jgi:hypothetical protein
MKKRTVVMGIVLAVVVSMAFPCWGGDNIYYGCYQKYNGMLRIVIDSGECRPSEVPISWNRIGPPGLTWQGPWNDEVTYELDDAVSYNGSSYISLVGQNIGNPPDLFPAFWDMLVQKGDTGAQGDKGDKGDRGEPGAPGATGAPGAAGHTPVLSWSGDQIAIDGVVTGPHLTGPQGPQGLAGPPGPSGASVYPVFYTKAKPSSCAPDCDWFACYNQCWDYVSCDSPQDTITEYSVDKISVFVASSIEVEDVSAPGSGYASLWFQIANMDWWQVAVSAKIRCLGLRPWQQ